MGYYAKALGDFSVAIGLNSDSSSPCTVSDDYSVGTCADAVEVNGNDMLELFSSRRALDERHEAVDKQATELGKMHSALSKVFASQDVELKALDEKMDAFDAMVKEFAAMEAELQSILSQ